MTKKANNHKKKSLCEKSMQMVVSFIKLSSLSLASISLGTTVSHPGRKGAVTPMNVLKVSRIHGNQRSQEPESNSMSYSYLMDPDENKGSSYMVSEINDDGDNRFSDYIQRFHEKNRRDLPFMLLPPPPPGQLVAMFECNFCFVVDSVLGVVLKFLEEYGSGRD